MTRTLTRTCLPSGRWTGLSWTSTSRPEPVCTTAFICLGRDDMVCRVCGGSTRGQTSKCGRCREKRAKLDQLEHWMTQLRISRQRQDTKPTRQRRPPTHGQRRSRVDLDDDAVERRNGRGPCRDAIYSGQKRAKAALKCIVLTGSLSQELAVDLDRVDLVVCINDELQLSPRQ